MPLNDCVLVSLGIYCSCLYIDGQQYTCENWNYDRQYSKFKFMIFVDVMSDCPIKNNVYDAQNDQQITSDIISYEDMAF